jgi:hypothetical protein
VPRAHHPAQAFHYIFLWQSCHEQAKRRTNIKRIISYQFDDDLFSSLHIYSYNREKTRTTKLIPLPEYHNGKKKFLILIVKLQNNIELISEI